MVNEEYYMIDPLEDFDFEDVKFDLEEVFDFEEEKPIENNMSYEDVKKSSLNFKKSSLRRLKQDKKEFPKIIKMEKDILKNLEEAPVKSAGDKKIIKRYKRMLKSFENLYNSLDGKIEYLQKDIEKSDK